MQASIVPSTVQPLHEPRYEPLSGASAELDRLHANVPAALVITPVHVDTSMADATRAPHGFLQWLHVSVILAVSRVQPAHEWL